MLNVFMVIDFWISFQLLSNFSFHRTSLPFLMLFNRFVADRCIMMTTLYRNLGNSLEIGCVFLREGIGMYGKILVPKCDNQFL